MINSLIEPGRTFKTEAVCEYLLLTQELFDEWKPMLGDPDNPGTTWVEEFGPVVDASDCLCLIANSPLPAAEAFTRWLCHDVLPSVVQTGMYAIDRTQFDDFLGGLPVFK